MSGSKAQGDGTAAERFAALFPSYPPRAHTNLREASVSEATVATYVESLNRFKFFIAAWGVKGSFGDLAPEGTGSFRIHFGVFSCNGCSTTDTRAPTPQPSYQR